MGSKVLITGGSGMIGRHLTVALKSAGYEVAHLSRTKSGNSSAAVFTWDHTLGHLEDGALDGVEYIVHLAGAGVADKRWTAERKKVIVDSRVQSAGLLYEKLKEQSHQVKAFISASGISIYGHDTGDAVCTEDTPANTKDFLGRVTVAWEAAADQFAGLGLRVVKLRTGIVLSTEGGAFPRLLLPVRLGAGAAIGTGRQYLSWIHLQDQIRLIRHCLEHDSCAGVYNAVAPDPVRNREIMRRMAGYLDRPFFLPNVPAFTLKLVYGEMAETVLGGNKVSPHKILDTGFRFQYPDLDSALRDLLG
jgi:uncharacterized protein (TIGR01777 family)